MAERGVDAYIPRSYVTAEGVEAPSVFMTTFAMYNAVQKGLPLLVVDRSCSSSDVLVRCSNRMEWPASALPTLPVTTAPIVKLLDACRAFRAQQSRRGPFFVVFLLGRSDFAGEHAEAASAFIYALSMIALSIPPDADGLRGVFVAEWEGFRDMFKGAPDPDAFARATIFPVSRRPNLPSAILSDLLLFLGDLENGRDAKLLQALGMDCVVDATNDEMSRTNVTALGVGYLPVNVQDVESEPISDYFESVTDWIDVAVKGRRRPVLVHCRAGISRSTTLVVAYLMMKQGIPLLDAVRMVASSRPIVRPNDGFIAQL